MAFETIIGWAARGFEISGVLVLVLGTIASPVLVAKNRPSSLRAESYRMLRQYIGAAILLGLELLIASDILRTLTEAPRLEPVLILGVIVLIRTFLSFTLEAELEGRWPWARSR
jgi:uncharacterized membrane protein